MRRYPNPHEQRTKRLNKIVSMQQSLSITYGPDVNKLVNPGKVGSVIEMDTDTFARLYGNEKKQEFDKQTARKSN